MGGGAARSLFARFLRFMPIEHGPPNLLRRDPGDSNDDGTPTRLGHSLIFFDFVWFSKRGNVWGG